MTLASIPRQVPRMFSDIANHAMAAPSVAVFLAALIAIYAVVAWRLVLSLPKWVRSTSGSPEDFRYMFDTALVAGGIGNLLAAGIAWENIDSARYLVFFFFAPILLLPAVWKGIARPRAVGVALVALLALCVYPVLASRVPLDPRAHARSVTADMSSCVASLGAHRGIANYWEARKLTFLSGGSLRVDQLAPWKTDNRNLLFYWGNNAFSFLRGHPGIDPYDYIVVDGLDPIQLEAMFGYPDEKRSCAGHEIWSYRDPTQVFGSLFQGNLIAYQYLLQRDSFAAIPAAAFAASTGSRDRLARQAQPRTDRPGYLIYGGYLALPPGSYRFTLDYSTSGTPSPPEGKLGRFEIFEPAKDRLLGLAEFAADPDAPHSLASIDIIFDEPATVEPRVFFSGVARLRVEEVQVANELEGERILRLRASDGRVLTQAGIKEDGLVKSAGRPGILLYGPYVSLPAGSYQATMYFSGEPPAGVLGKLQITGRDARAPGSASGILAESDVNAAQSASEPNGFRAHTTFRAPYPVADLEVRLLAGNAPLAVSHYEIAAVKN
jgi:hypothetical protein